MRDIQTKIIERNARNALSRLLHAKNDRETITAWKLDLDRTLHIFNVGSVTHARSSLTVLSQTELSINTHTAISDIHRTIMGTQGGTNGKNCSVSFTRAISTAESTLTVTQTRTRSGTLINKAPSLSYLHLAHLVNPRPHLQEHVLGATS